MIAIKNISIPEACHQSWQHMEDRSNGRHCLHCSKTVIDFTSMSNDEIIGYLTTTNNVCGRFVPIQLDDVNHQVSKEDMPEAITWKSWLLAAGIFAATLFTKLSAQTSTPVSAPTEQNAIGILDKKMPMMGKVSVSNIAKTRIIKGQILDENNLPLPGAAVSVCQGNSGTMTNANGEFELAIPLSSTKLLVRFIGYNSKELVIDPNTDPNYQVKLQLSAAMMGEVVIVKRPFLKRMYSKLIKRPIRKIFR